MENRVVCCSRPGQGSIAERSELAGAAQHLVDFVEVHFFLDDHLSGEFFEQNGFPLGDFQQIMITLERQAFMLEAFPQDFLDVMTLCF